MDEKIEKAKEAEGKKMDESNQPLKDSQESRNLKMDAQPDSHQHDQEDPEKVNLVEEMDGEDVIKKENETEEEAPPLSLEAKLEAMEIKYNKYRDLYMRKSADLDNYRRQKEKHFLDFVRYADENVIRAFLPIVDDISRTLKSAEESKSSDIEAFVTGLKLIQQNIEKILEERGVKKLDVLGKKLDVSYHEAMAQVEKAGVDPEVIVEVFEDGYQLHDRVIRHAKVIVSK